MLTTQLALPHPCGLHASAVHSCVSVPCVCFIHQTHIKPHQPLHLHTDLSLSLSHSLANLQQWIPPVPCHHENERKKEGWRERGSEQVSRCDLCWHCMSMLMKKKGGEGEIRTLLVHAAVFWLPASHCAVPCWCATHTCPFFFSSSTPPLCIIMHTVHVHACLCQCPVCSTHMT